MRHLSPKLPETVRRLFRLPLTRERALRGVDDELRFHFQMRVAEFRQLGMSQREAEAEAARKFGDSEDFLAAAHRRAERRVRRVVMLRWLSDCVLDIRVAVRQFR